MLVSCHEYEVSVNIKIQRQRLPEKPLTSGLYVATVK